MTPHEPEPSRIEITHHAALRFLQRVDAAEQNPTERIRELLANAERTSRQVTHGVGWLADGAIVVTDDDLEAVRTVLQPEASP
jgi:hypothetical protein